MKTIISISLSLLISFQINAQKRAWQSVYADEITATELEEHLEVLASDEYRGRETGDVGQKMAADYLADFYKSLGLPNVGKNNSYFQTIPLEMQEWENVSIKVNDKEFAFLEDFYCFSRSTSSCSLTESEVVFVGYGIDDEAYSNYKNIDVTNKVVLLLDGEPKLKNGNYLLTKNEEPSKWSSSWRTKLATAKTKGAKAVLIIKDDAAAQIKRNDHSINSPSLKLIEKATSSSNYPPNFYISNNIAQNLFGKKFNKQKKKAIKRAAKKRNISTKLKTNLAINVTKKIKDVSGENVFGYIEGSDLKDELIVLTAHYDHLGKHDGKIYNGADDNGTGTVALMEIAESFVKAKEN